MFHGLKSGMKAIKAASTTFECFIVHVLYFLNTLSCLVQWDIDKLTSQVSFLSNTHIVHSCSLPSHLPSVPAQLSQKAVRTDARGDERRLGQLLALRSVIRGLPPLLEALRGSKSEILTSAAEVRVPRRQP